MAAADPAVTQLTYYLCLGCEGVRPHLFIVWDDQLLLSSLKSTVLNLWTSSVAVVVITSIDGIFNIP